MTNFSYAAIFQARMLIPPDFNLVLHPVKIETTNAGLNLQIPAQHTRVHVIGKGEPFGSVVPLEIPKGERLLVIYSQSKEEGPQALRQLEQQVDDTITKLSAIYQPQLFFECLYRGPIFRNGKGIFAGYFRPAEQQTIKADEAKKALLNCASSLDRNGDAKSRFDLMARFYAKAFSYDPSEEAFMLLWTILEIFPMKNTSDIKPLRQLLASITNRTVSEVDNKLQIGRLYGARCNLVHDGKLDHSKISDTFKLLDAIVDEVVRHMLGLPYGGKLEGFF